jgi:hypothetical protein
LSSLILFFAPFVFTTQAYQQAGGGIDQSLKINEATVKGAGN